MQHYIRIEFSTVVSSIPFLEGALVAHSKNNMGGQLAVKALNSKHLMSMKVVHLRIVLMTFFTMILMLHWPLTEVKCLWLRLRIANELF
ncbi:MAG: hypothetical protein ACI8VC_002075 [Candidatus Endobugula sp.]|jgi:hypothetical protein